MDEVIAKLGKSKPEASGVKRKFTKNQEANSSTERVHGVKSRLRNETPQTVHFETPAQLEANAKALKRTNPDLATLTDNEVIAIRAYTSNLYKEINPGLRGDDILLKKWEPVVKNAESGMDKLAKVPGRRIQGNVYRGTSLSDSRVLSIYPDNGIHSDAAFKSTALKKNSSFPGNVREYIKSKTGVRIDDLSSAGPSEAEILFKPGTQFKVLSKSKDASGVWNIYGGNIIIK